MLLTLRLAALEQLAPVTAEQFVVSGGAMKHGPVSPLSLLPPNP